MVLGGHMGVFFNRERRFRWFGWLVLSVLSTFCAEVTCGNEPFAFFGLGKWMLMVSLYGLHVLILGSIFYHRSKRSFALIYVLGMFFGMYEAYVTKMIWNPDAYEVIRFADIAVIEFSLLVFFWHAFMAFIFPLMLAEIMVSPGRDLWEVMPEFIRSRRGRVSLLVWFAIFCGVFHGATLGYSNRLSGWTVLASSIGNCMIVLVFLLAWRNLYTEKRISMVELLPTMKERRVLLFILGILYCIWFVTFRFDKLPGISGHLAVCFFYLLFWVMHRQARARATGLPPENHQQSREPLRVKLWLVFSAIFIPTSLIVFYMPFTKLVVTVYMLGLALFGFCMFITVFYRLFLRRKRLA